MDFDWNDIAFGSKKAIKELGATFVVAPRDISEARLTEIIKTYLPKGNIVLGISKEQYVLGFDKQPQFKMLDEAKVLPLINKIASSKSPNKLYVLRYQQMDLRHILEKIKFREVVLVNGSWKHSFHHTQAFYTLIQSKTPMKYVGAYVDEAEAKISENKLTFKIAKPAASIGDIYDEIELLGIANEAAKLSYDYTFQTGVALAKKTKNGYKLLNYAFNKVVPYQTYAFLNGSLREQQFSPANDLNFYDTVHAETMLIINAVHSKLDLGGTTLFINLLPCPSCARILGQSDISEVVYTEDHSDGYAIKMLELCGKTVRRLVP